MGKRLGGVLAAFLGAGSVFLAFGGGSATGQGGSTPPPTCTGDTTTTAAPPDCTPTTTAEPATAAPTAPTTAASTTAAPTSAEPTTAPSTLPPLQPFVSVGVLQQNGHLIISANSNAGVGGVVFRPQVYKPRPWMPGDPPAEEHLGKTYKAPAAVTIVQNASNEFEIDPANSPDLHNGQQLCVELDASAGGYADGKLTCDFNGASSSGNVIVTYTWTPPATAPPANPGSTPGNNPGSTPGTGPSKPPASSPPATAAPSGGGPIGGPNAVPLRLFTPVREEVSQFAVGAKPFPTIQWLWRPEWFQPTPAQKLSPGDDPAQSQKKVAIEVDPNDPPQGSSAMPWLAGLGVFGAFGIGLMTFRRYRAAHPAT